MISSPMIAVASGTETSRPTPMPAIALNISLNKNTNDRIARMAMWPPVMLAAAAAEGVARQPGAADKITGAVNLPLFLLEGVAILAEVFVLLIVLLK